MHFLYFYLCYRVGSVLNVWKRDGDNNDFDQVANFLATSAGNTARASLIVAVKELIASLDFSKGVIFCMDYLSCLAMFVSFIL